MAFEGKLGGLDLMNLSDAELDTMYGYAEEHLKRVADIRKNGLKETKEYSKEEVAKTSILGLPKATVYERARKEITNTDVINTSLS